MTAPVIEVARSTEVLRRWPDPPLSGSEQVRVAALRRLPDRQDFVAARLLAREVVGHFSGVAPAAVVLHQSCTGCGGPHGRPTVTGQSEVQVSWSHSGGAVAAMAAGVACGIDVEPLRPVRPVAGALTVAERAVVAAATDPSRAFLEFWTRKEAAVKTGVTGLDDVGRIAVADLEVRWWSVPTESSWVVAAATIP